MNFSSGLSERESALWYIPVSLTDKWSWTLFVTIVSIWNRFWNNDPVTRTSVIDLALLSYISQGTFLIYMPMMVGRPEAGVCESREFVILSTWYTFSVFRTEMFSILAWPRKCIGGSYTRESFYACSDSQGALWAFEVSSTKLKLVCECRKAFCVLSRWKTVILL